MADIRKIRNFVRTRKTELEVLGDFDEWLTKITNLEAHVKGLEGQAAEMEKVKADADAYVAQQKAAAKKAVEEANKKVKAAQEKADAANKQAQGVAEEAAETLARAKAEADRIESAGRQRGVELAEGEEGTLKELRDAIAAAKRERTSVLNDIAALEKRRDDMAAEVERLRRKFG